MKEQLEERVKDGRKMDAGIRDVLEHRIRHGQFGRAWLFQTMHLIPAAILEDIAAEVYAEQMAGEEYKEAFCVAKRYHLKGQTTVEPAVAAIATELGKKQYDQAIHIAKKVGMPLEKIADHVTEAFTREMQEQDYDEAVKIYQGFGMTQEQVAVPAQEAFEREIGNGDYLMAMHLVRIYDLKDTRQGALQAYEREVAAGNLEQAFELAEDFELGRDKRFIVQRKLVEKESADKQKNLEEAMLRDIFDHAEEDPAQLVAGEPYLEVTYRIFDGTLRYITERTIEHYATGSVRRNLPKHWAVPTERMPNKAPADVTLYVLVKDLEAATGKPAEEVLPQIEQRQCLDIPVARGTLGVKFCFIEEIPGSCCKEARFYLGIRARIHEPEIQT